jgi:hypothetical protein
MEGIYMLQLTKELLMQEAIDFCKIQSLENHITLLGISDGKAVGTYVEHKFQNLLEVKYNYIEGNSARGIDLPSESINTDIKVTHIKQPQSSCPFRGAKQKIYGLGYNLLVFVYNKIDNPQENTCKLNFANCTFIDKERTADFQTTTMIREIIKNDGNKDDIIAYFYNINLPGDDITYNSLAEKVLEKPPLQGFLTISNALQWRLQYRRVINLDNKIEGVFNLYEG